MKIPLLGSETIVLTMGLARTIHAAPKRYRQGCTPAPFGASVYELLSHSNQLYHCCTAVMPSYWKRWQTLCFFLHLGFSLLQAFELSTVPLTGAKGRLGEGDRLQRKHRRHTMTHGEMRGSIGTFPRVSRCFAVHGYLTRHSARNHTALPTPQPVCPRIVVGCSASVFLINELWPAAEARTTYTSDTVNRSPPRPRSCTH